MIDVDDPGGRARLRALLRARYAWLDVGAPGDERFGPGDAGAPEAGPRTVEAGECDRCEREPRLAALCGPLPWAAVGRRCADQIGRDGWCVGHAEHADRVLAWLARLPQEADLVTRLWWVATGEVRVTSLPEWAPALGALERGEALPSPRRPRGS